MKIKSLFYILVMGVFGCCTTESPVIPEPSLPVGSWNIVQVDSGYTPIVPAGTFHSRGTLNVSGRISFNENSTGSWDGDVDRITCSLDDFNWIYSDSLNLIYFVCSGKLTKGKILQMQKDTLIFDYKDWCKVGSSLQGAELYYRITAIK